MPACSRRKGTKYGRVSLSSILLARSGSMGRMINIGSSNYTSPSRPTAAARLPIIEHLCLSVSLPYIHRHRHENRIHRRVRPPHSRTNPGRHIEGGLYVRPLNRVDVLPHASPQPLLRIEFQKHVRCYRVIIISVVLILE